MRSADRIKRLNPKSKREGLYLDTAEWEEAVEAYARMTGEDTRTIIKNEAKLLVRDCIKLTPPTTGGTGILKENLKKQERAGKKAILDDIQRVVKDVTQLKMYENPKVKKWIDRAFKNHDWKLVLDIVGGGVGAGKDIPPKYHEQFRDKRGRVNKTTGGRFYIRDTKAKKKLNRYAKTYFDKIGQAKAGWLPAARALKLAAKNHYIKFISRHSGKGRVVMNLKKGTKNPFVIVANLEQHAQKHDKGGKIMAVALKIRKEVLQDKIVELHKERAKQFNQKKAMTTYIPEKGGR